MLIIGNDHFTVQFIYRQIIHKNQNKRKIIWRMSVIDYKDFKENFVIKDKLGKGNCASVVQVQHKKSLQLFALKYSRFSGADKLATAFQELEVVRALNHPTAIEIFYCFVKTNNAIVMNQMIEFGIVMELGLRNLEQDMNQRRKNCQFYTTLQIQQLTINLIQFFAHAQSKGYLHRDIKPANILIMPEPQKKSQSVLKTNKKYCMNPEPKLAHQNTQSQQPKKPTQEKFIKYKVCDFGFGTRNHEFSSKNIAGTACYASPKIRTKFNNTQTCIAGNNFRDDVYSLGITLIQLASLESAEHNAPKSLLIKISNRYGIRFSQILQSMIENNQAKRPDFLKLKQDYPNYIGFSHKVINKTKVADKKKSKNLKVNKPQDIVIPYHKQKSPSKNQIKLATPQLKIHLPTQKKLKQSKNLKPRQKQDDLTKKLIKKYTFLPHTDDYQRFKYLPQERKQMDDDEPMPKKVHYNLKTNKLIQDKLQEGQNTKVEKKNKKNMIQDKKDDKKDEKKDDKKDDKIVVDKKRTVEYPQLFLQKEQIKFKYNDKVKTKRKSKNQSNFKIELINEQKNNKTKKINEPYELYEQKKIIDRESEDSQERQSSEGTKSIKNTIWIESTAAEEESAKNLIKLCISKLKQELISYIITDLQLNPNKNDDKYVDGSENQQIYSQKIRLNEATTLIICVGHENFLNIYYKLPKQRFQSLCLVFDEGQKLIYTEYSVQTQKLAIVTKRNKIKIISLQGIMQLISNSTTSNIKSIHADLLKTVLSFNNQTNNMNSFAFSDYLQSIFKVKDDGSFWENNIFLGILPNKKVNIKFIKKFENYIFLATCQGQIFKYKIKQNRRFEDNYSGLQKNKNDASINLMEYYKCKNTIIGFELLRSNTSKNTKIVVINAIGQVFIFSENLEIIKIKNLSRNALVACHISLQVLPDTEYFNICAVDCFGNLINELGQVIGQTKVYDCLSIFVDYDRDMAYLTTQNGYIYEARIRPSLI